MNRRTFLTSTALGGAATVLAAPVPKEIFHGINRLMFTRGIHFRTINPDGNNESEIPGVKDLKGGSIPTIQRAMLSPDGKRLAWIYADPKRGTQLYIRGFDADGAGEFVHDGYTPVDWLSSTDLVIHWDDHDPKTKPESRYHLYDLKTRKTVPLKLEPGERISQILSDGRILTSCGADDPPSDPVVWRMRKGPAAPELFFKASRETYPYGFVLSHDAKRLAFIRSDPDIGWPGGERKWEIFVRVLDGTKPVLVATVPEGFNMSGYAWEPSGKRLAYSTSPSSQVEPDEQRSQLLVVDAAGGKPKLIAEHDPKAKEYRVLQVTAWR